MPVVETEVLMDGSHSLSRCAEVTEQVLRIVFDALHSQGVALEAMILKPNTVLAGSECRAQPSVVEVADATMTCLSRAVPPAVPGIAFLSGGQSAQLAPARLSALNQRSGSEAPWGLSFSFGRAIQQPALKLWAGNAANVVAAQQALAHRADCNRAAHGGHYDPTMEAA
jgi:fructose-bisphosphate aldolase class I